MLPAAIAEVIPAEDVLTLKPNCVSCGRRVEVRFVGWRDRNRQYPRDPEWDCPYCREQNVLVTRGVVIGADRMPE